MLKEAGGRGGGQKLVPLEQHQDWGFSKGKNVELGRAMEWAQWQWSSPTLERDIIPNLLPPALLPSSVYGNSICYSGQRHWTHPWILFLSLAPHICSVSQYHQTGVRNTEQLWTFLPFHHFCPASSYHCISPKGLTWPLSQSLHLHPHTSILNPAARWILLKPDHVSPTVRQLIQNKIQERSVTYQAPYCFLQTRKANSKWGTKFPMDELLHLLEASWISGQMLLWTEHRRGNKNFCFQWVSGLVNIKDT